MMLVHICKMQSQSHSFCNPPACFFLICCFEYCLYVRINEENNKSSAPSRYKSREFLVRKIIIYLLNFHLFQEMENSRRLRPDQIRIYRGLDAVSWKDGVSLGMSTFSQISTHISWYLVRFWWQSILPILDCAWHQEGWGASSFHIQLRRVW